MDRTSFQNISRNIEKQLRLLTSDLNYTLNQLQSSCSACTMNKIKHFLSNSALEIFTILQARKHKKLPSSGEYTSRAFSRTRQYTSNVSHNTNHQSSVTSHTTHTHDHDTDVNQDVNHSTSTTRNRRRRRKRKNTNKYWRRNNHNIQLDTNAVINLSNINLTHDETQLLARGLS